MLKQCLRVAGMRDRFSRCLIASELKTFGSKSVILLQRRFTAVLSTQVDMQESGSTAADEPAPTRHPPGFPGSDRWSGSTAATTAVADEPAPTRHPPGFPGSDRRSGSTAATTASDEPAPTDRDGLLTVSAG